jgi:hypothetical protein
MMDSIFDNIIFDYGIYDPQVQGAPIDGHENTGNAISFKADMMTMRLVEDTNVVSLDGDKLTMKIQ